MKEEGYSGEEDYADVDGELLQDFERELEAEEKARKRRLAYVAVGLALGLALAVALAGPWNGEQAGVAVKTPVKEAEKTAPAPVKEDMDSQLAKLQEQNLIDEDFKAPGALIEDESMTPEEPEKDSPAVDEPSDDEEIPITEKKISTAPEEGTTETEAAQSGGRDSSEPAQPQEQETIEKAPPAKAVAEFKPSTESRETKTSKERGKAPSASGAIESETQKTEGKWEPFSVQVMATSDGVKAIELRDELMAKGFDAWISTGKVKKRLYRVESGEFKSIREASSLSGALGEAGFASRIAHIKNKSRVTLVVGAFGDRAAAKRLAARVKSARLPARVEDRSGLTDFFIVRVGKYRTRDEADRKAESVKKAGYEVMGVVR